MAISTQIHHQTKSNSSLRRKTDYNYLICLTNFYGCRFLLELWAIRIAGHTDIESFTADEWTQFVTAYQDVIGEFIAAEHFNASSH